MHATLYIFLISATGYNILAYKLQINFLALSRISCRVIVSVKCYYMTSRISLQGLFLDMA